MSHCSCSASSGASHHHCLLYHQQIPATQQKFTTFCTTQKTKFSTKNTAFDKAVYLSSNTTTQTSQHKRPISNIPPPSTSFFIFLLLSSLFIPPSIGRVFRSDHVECEDGISKCWDLHQMANEVLQINMDFSSSKHPSISSVEKEKECKSFRTFHQCLANISSSCHGHLPFHSAQKVIERRMKQSGCPNQGPVLEQKHHHKQAHPPQICTYKHNHDPPPSNHLQINPKYRVCGIFGNLHVRIFDQQYQSCDLVGAIPAVDNNHFSIQLTVSRNTYPLVSKVTVIIKQRGECTHPDHYVTYEASSQALPSSFHDGSTSFGADHSVRVAQQSSGHVVISMRHIDTFVHVRRVFEELSVFVKMPSEVVEGGQADDEYESFEYELNEDDEESLMKMFKGENSLFDSLKPSMPGRSMQHLLRRGQQEQEAEKNLQLCHLGCPFSRVKLKEHKLHESSCLSLSGYFQQACFHDANLTGKPEHASIALKTSMADTFKLSGSLESVESLTLQRRRGVNGAHHLCTSLVLILPLLIHRPNLLLFICLVFLSYICH